MYKTLMISAFLTLFLQSGALSAVGGHHQLPGLQDFYKAVIIHTDRDFYIAGERLYFRLDLLSGDNEPVSGTAYLVLRNRDNTVIESSSPRIDGNSGFGSIYLPDTLSSSVYQLVAFTNWMRNFGEDHYASKQIIIVNRFDEESYIEGISSGLPDMNSHMAIAGSPYPEPGPGNSSDSGNLPVSGEHTIATAGQSVQQDRPVTIKTSKTVYGTREKVSIELTPSGLSGSFASLAVSVAQKQTLLPEDSGQCFPAKIIHHQMPPIQDNTSFLKEVNGPLVTGQVVQRNSHEGIPDATVILTTPDSVLNLLYAKTLNDGTFHFRLNDYYEGKELFFSILDMDISTNADIRIIEKSSLEHPFEPGIKSGNELSPDFIRTSQDIVRINKTLNIDLNMDIETERQGFRPEIYSSPDYSIASFRDYEYLENMHEIARELLPVLMVRYRDGQYNSRMMLEFRGPYTEILPPIYFLDGIYTDDINRIMHLDSDDMQTLELHNHNWRHGDIMFPGIVAIFSTNQEYRNLKLSDPSVTFENHPGAVRSLYNPPDYEKDIIISPRPDFRQLLFWDPEITVENNDNSKLIEFFSGDLKGEFIIRAAGYTDDGKIISEKFSIIIDDKLEEKETTVDFPRPEESEANKTISHKTEPEEILYPGNNVQQPVTNLNIPDKYFEQGLSGKVNLPLRQPIGDQHYPTEEWLSGDVVLGNGIVVNGKLLRYNAYMDELFWLFEGDYQQIQVDKHMVKEFRLNLPRRDKPLNFRRIEVNAPIMIGKDEIFGELLYEGDVSLYSYRRIIDTGLGEYWAGDVKQGGMIIKPSHLYVFILPDGTTEVIRRISRRNILNLFPENRSEIRRLFRDKSLRRLRDEQDLIEAIRILNSFLNEN